jgi:hypothetical protein
MRCRLREVQAGEHLSLLEFGRRWSLTPLLRRHGSRSCLAVNIRRAPRGATSPETAARRLITAMNPCRSRSAGEVPQNPLDQAVSDGAGLQPIPFVPAGYEATLGSLDGHRRNLLSRSRNRRPSRRRPRCGAEDEHLEAVGAGLEGSGDAGADPNGVEGSEQRRASARSASAALLCGPGPRSSVDRAAVSYTAPSPQAEIP